MRRSFLLLVGLPFLTSCVAIGGGPSEPDPGLTSFVPSVQDPDPSVRIDGIRVQRFDDPQHVTADQQVAYTFTPPMGGSHDQAWATCNGVVYPEPVRSENLVHSLEHGTVWIAYDPGQLDADDVAALANKVDGQQYLVLSPYPGLEQPISLQSWGHQLALDDVADPRIDQFITALRTNPKTFPEPGASCAEVGGYFDQGAPPAFVPPPAVDAVNGSTVMPE